MWLRWISNSTFWLGVENLKKIQRIWQNTKYKMMFQIQEVGKCYLFLIFTRFLWTYMLLSKSIIETPLRPFPKEKKIWSMIGKILLHNRKDLGKARYLGTSVVHSKNSWVVWDGGSNAVPRKICNFYPYLILESVFSS